MNVTSTKCVNSRIASVDLRIPPFKMIMENILRLDGDQATNSSYIVIR